MRQVVKANQYIDYKEAKKRVRFQAGGYVQYPKEWKIETDYELVYGEEEPVLALSYLSKPYPYRNDEKQEELTTFEKITCVIMLILELVILYEVAEILYLIIS